MSISQRYIFDFDSTFIQVEAIDILAGISLKNDPLYSEKMALIQDLTRNCMEGKISYQESISERYALLNIKPEHIQQTIAIVQQKITPSFLRNKAFFKANADKIYVISGAFIEILWPVVESFGLKRDHVYGNRFLYDFEGNIKDYDRFYVLSQDQSKVKLVQQLKLGAGLIMIGDGYNDYELKEAGLVDLFIAFTENVRRESVIKVADAVIDNLEGLFITCSLPYTPPPDATKVLLLENIHADVASYYHQCGYQVETLPNALSEAELLQKLPGISLLGIRSKTQISAACLSAATDLQAIGAFCIGTNQIDLKACSQQGIAVFNAPYSNTRSVVELCMGEMILLGRKATVASSALKQGIWHKTSEGAHEIRGKTLGIVGYGHIGAQLSVIAEALGMQVLFYDIVDKLPLGNAKACPTMESLLRASDVVTLHVDGRPENAQLIGEKEFALMKKGALFLNLSRDFVVDLDALQNALQQQQLAGAAVDVFPNEPLSSKGTYKTPLAACDNVILTPHIGGSTEEAQSHIGSYVSRHLSDYLEEGYTIGSVNFPPLLMPAMEEKPTPPFERLLHVHHNVPGILAQINAFFAKAEINIQGQLLKTNEAIGYVITDINKPLSAADLAGLKQIPHTIKVRSIKKLNT